MNINNDYSKKVDSGVDANSGAPHSGASKSQDKPNTVFENNEIACKKKLTLNEKELKYLLSQGYDLTKMSDKDIQDALEPYYAETPKDTQNASTETYSAVAQSANLTDTAASSTAQPSAQTEGETSAQQAQTKPAETSASQSAVPVNNQASAQQAKNEADKNNYPTEIEIDFDDADLKQMGFAPDEVGIYACDFEKLTKEEQENFLVTAFAKRHFGKNWENMPPEAQAKILQSIDAQLAEKIPSWKNLSSEEKATLGASFLIGSDEGEKYRYSGDTNSYSDNIAEMSFDQQIEFVAKKIMSSSYDEKIKKLHTDENEDIGNVEFKYLDDKVKKSGLESLNEIELENYKYLSEVKKIYGDKPPGAVLGELNQNKETSTFAIMQKDEHYKEVYSKTINKTGDAKIAEKVATADWFIHQFEGVDEKDREAKYIELIEKCTSRQERLMLTSLANKIGQEKIVDAQDAFHKYLLVKESGDANEQLKTAESIAEAFKDGTVDEDIVAGITADIPDSYEKDAVAPATISLTRVSGKAAVAVVENTKNGKYSVEQQEEIFQDPIKNPDLQKNKESTYILGRAIGHTDASIQIGLNKTYTDYAVKSKDADLMQAIAIGVPEYSKENQTPAFKNVLLGSEQFDDEDAISIQKTLANQIAKSDKSNQLDMHSDIMKSKFSEVQEQAAENIKNYDPSVQNAAIDKVYESKNTKAIQVVLENLDKMPPQVQKIETTRLIGEIAHNGAVKSGLLETKIMNGTLSARELMQLTPTQRREYFVKQFEEASPTKKLEILKKLASASSGVYKKTIYTIIARFSSPLLKSMVEGGLGKSMLDAGLPIDAVNKVIIVMKSSTNNEVIEQLKELKLDASFEKYFDEKEDADASDKKSVTIPPEFGNDVKKIFSKKGSKGNALMDIKS